MFQLSDPSDPDSDLKVKSKVKNRNDNPLPPLSRIDKPIGDEEWHQNTPIQIEWRTMKAAFQRNLADEIYETEASNVS